MTKLILKTLFTSILLIGFTSCDVKIDPNLNYTPVFNQDGAVISLKTQSVPVTGMGAYCEVHAIITVLASKCDLDNFHDGYPYCYSYGSYFITQPDFYPLKREVTNSSDENKTFQVTTMRERKGSYNYSAVKADYDSYTGLLLCYSETFQYGSSRNIYKKLFEKNVTFSPDISYAIPLHSEVHLVENLTNTSARITFKTFSKISSGARLQRSLDNSTWTTLTTLSTKTALPPKYGYSEGWAYEAFEDTGLQPATSYYYRAVNFGLGGDADSAPSIKVTTLSSGGATPTAPTGLATAGITASSIDLSWTDNSNNETGFEIEQSLDGVTNWVNITTTSADSTNFTDTGLSASTAYYYRVRAINAAGNSAYSATVNATTAAGGCSAPFDPMNLNLFLIGMSQINLTWMDTAIDETGYTVERSTTSSAGPFTTLVTLGANITTHSDTGLAAGATFYYRVKATKTGCTDSGYTSVQSETTPGSSAPFAPSALAGFPDPIASPEITITWQDNSSNETGFEIERSTVGGGVGFSLIHTASANDLTYNDNTASASTTYYYRIRAVNASGNSTYTAEVMVNNP